MIADLEQIRNKRLAKLGSTGPSPSPDLKAESSASASASQSPSLNPENDNTNTDANETTTPKINVSEPSQTPRPMENPFSQLGLKQTNGARPNIKISSSNTAQTNSLKRDRPSFGSGERSNSASSVSLDVWTHKTISNIFRLTLDAKVRKDVHGHALFYVNGVREELEEQDAAVQLTTDILDQAILEAASEQGKSTPLDYLLSCWKRVSRLLKTAKSSKMEEAKIVVIKEARRLCMSYCIFAITMPDMFG